MNQAGQNSSLNPDWLKNFGMPKNTRQNDALDRAIYAAKNQAASQSGSSTAQSSTGNSTSNSANSSPAAPKSSNRPLSAQEIINARYQAQPAAQPSSTRPALSARDAINAARSKSDANSAQTAKKAASDPAASQVEMVPEPSKSAARLHHGFIQKSMASTRPSASAILGTNSPDGEVPVVSTSLKLGANVLPKKPVAVLPPNARMARAAKSLDQPSTGKKLLGKIARKSDSHKPVDAQIILPDAAETRSALSAGLVAGDAQTARRASSASASSALSSFSSSSSSSSSSASSSTRAAKPARRKRPGSTGKVSQIPIIQSGATKIEVHSDHEEPAAKSSARRARQPLGIGARLASNSAKPHKVSSIKVQTADQPSNLSPDSQRNPRASLSLGPQQRSDQVAALRDANAKIGAAALQALMNGDITPESLGLSQNDLQTIAAAQHNQDLKTTLTGKTVGDLGVIEDYAPAEGRVKGSESGAAPSAGLSARDPKNPKAHKAEDSRHTLGKQSPFFLKSVNVEKRPLSHDNGGIPAGPRNVSAAVSPEKPVKLGTVRTVSRHSTFAKAPKAPKTPKAKRAKNSPNLPDRPTVIVPASHRSNAPLFFLLLLTILLGAAVGAAAYLCFFQ